MADITFHLSEEEFTKMRNDFFAEKSLRHRMTQPEIKDLADRLNKKFNIPLVSETKEGIILAKIVLKIDNFLYNNLPNEIYDLIRSIDKGISDKEAKSLIKRLTKLANDKIDIPYLPEIIEKHIIKFLIATILNGLRKKWDIKKACNNSNQIKADKEENLLKESK